MLQTPARDASLLLLLTCYTNLSEPERMAPTNKAKKAGVSASSFFDLKAELAKKEEQFARDKAAGMSASLAGGVKRPDKVGA